MSRWSTLGVWGAWGACAFIIQPVVGVMPLVLGWLLFYPFMGALCWLFVPQSFLYLKALELLGGECFFKKTMKKSDTYNE